MNNKRNDDQDDLHARDLIAEGFVQMLGESKLPNIISTKPDDHLKKWTPQNVSYYEQRQSFCAFSIRPISGHKIRMREIIA